MDFCDVLIVGGGPAGSSCAWGLRRSGLRVALMDKCRFPRDKVCGGWITPRVAAALEIDLAYYARHCVLQPITGFRVSSIGGPAVETGYDAPVSYGIRRCEFDEHLLRRCGASLCLGEALTSLRRPSSGSSGAAWIADERLQARVVVGAGGHFCPVARLAKTEAAAEAAPREAESPVVAQEVEFLMDPAQLSACRVRGEVPELYFCRDMKGYGWCFRKGAYLNVGLGRADPHRLSAHVAEFLQFLKSEGRIPFDLPPLRGHAYLLRGTSPRSLVSDGLLLIGDSAGLAQPQSGEGIWPAVESGLLAARAIIAANGAYLRPQLEAYSSMLAARPDSAARNLGKYLPAACIGFLGRSLLRTRWFVRRVVLDKWFLSQGDSTASPA